MIVYPNFEKHTGKISFAASVVYYSILILVLTCCAKVGSPTGGPKDENPPEVIESDPENRATNNKSEQIEITFDEFIALKNLNDELIISPPMKERPITRIRNKTLVIDLNNELKDSTTYTLNFGNAIADNNEGNSLPDYEFVFSTGPVIDSLSLTGSAVNAFNLKPEKEKVTVMLYDNLSDSAPYNDLPLYISRTSPEGKFAINNIHPDTFRLFALKDVNNNFKFDIPDEMIAFSDTLIILSPERVRRINFIKDTSALKIKPKIPEKKSGNRADTLSHDTIKFPGKELYAASADLFLFTEEDMRQNIISKNRERRELLTFEFNRPLFDSLQLKLLDPANPKWCLQDMSVNRDTVRIWITDSTLIKKDTLSLALVYTTTDSARNFISRTDTVIMRFRKKELKRSSARGPKEETETLPDSVFLNLTASIRKQAVLDLNRSVRIASPSPVSAFDPQKFSLIRFEDTLQYIQPINVFKDSSDFYSVIVSTVWTEDLPYKLTIEPGAITDIYGITNDTLMIAFKTQMSDYYGKIIISFDSQVFPVIIQLMDEKENLLAEKILAEKGMVTFDYLSPKKYRLKAVVDVNRNKKWDTGNYLHHSQPEKIGYYPLPIDVRSNWDVEISWNMDDSDEGTQ